MLKSSHERHILVQSLGLGGETWHMIHLKPK
jgi:hypothetical protein